MQIFKVSEKIEIVCESENTRLGFRHVATLLLNGYEEDQKKICYQNRTWERYCFESVLYKMAESTFLSEDESNEVKKYVKEYNENSRFETVAMIAKIGEVFSNDKKEANDWKNRMLKAGIGLDMPEDWDSLSEEQKEDRLNKTIKAMEGGL